MGKKFSIDSNGALVRFLAEFFFLIYYIWNYVRKILFI